MYSQSNCELLKNKLLYKSLFYFIGHKQLIHLNLSWVATAYLCMQKMHAFWGPKIPTFKQSKVHFIKPWQNTPHNPLGITYGWLQHAITTFCHMQFQFWIGKFLIKMQQIAVRFYLGYWKQPWFGPAGFENTCIFRMCKRRVATQL